MPLPLTLYLAAPRGFCAGVDRAIKIVEMALAKWGAPVMFSMPPAATTGVGDTESTTWGMSAMVATRPV